MCACFGLVWNPRQDREFAPREIAMWIEEGYKVRDGWRLSTRKRGIGPGDPFLLLRVGAEPRGVVGFGSTAGTPTNGGIDIGPTLIVDADATPDDVLPIPFLTKRFPGRINANIQGSGFELTAA